MKVKGGMSALIQKMATNETVVKVFVSTIPGLEFICVSECDEVFEVKSRKEGRGRVSFSTAIKSLPKLCKLKSVHHFWLQVYQSSDYFLADTTKEETLEGLEKLIGGLQWKLAVYAFNYFKENELKDDGDRKTVIASANDSEDNPPSEPNSLLAKESAPSIDSNKRKGVEDLKIEQKFSKTSHRLDCVNAQERTLISENDSNINSFERGTGFSDSHNNIISGNTSEDQNNLLSVLNKIPSDVKFRVTCNRTGKHNFTSMEAAKYIGSGVKGYFGWSVDLENFDIEILAFIENLEITIAMKLSLESKHNRNVKYFGPTTLRATTSYCMLKLAGVKSGDIICDPMCGTGSICLEGINSFPASFHLGGELHAEGCQNARNNLDFLESTRKSGLPYDVLSWDACRLPLRDNLLDVIVCDLPFGKRIGYKGKNFALYPAVLNEIARVCRYKGKAVLLTQHKSAMNKALNSCNQIWKKQGSFFMNMGGLNAGIYVLKKIAH